MRPYRKNGFRVAGAQWSPVSVADPDRRTAAYEAQFERAARIAYRRFQDLVGEDYGIRWLPNYFLADAPMDGFGWEMDVIGDLYPELADLPEGTHPFPAPFARRLMTMHIEPARYLRALMRDFQLRGGRIVVREFADIRQLAGLSEPLICNCTGLGAADLFGDDELIPLKGQLTVLLPQPEIDYITIYDGLYMMPRTDGIILGGTREREVASLEPDPEAGRRILEGHRRFFSRMG